jgi:putative flippase GtrA
VFRQILSISILRKFVYFSGVGLIATSIQYVILIVLVQGFGLDPVRASGIGFVTSAVVNYVLNYHVTFESRKAHSEVALKFMVIAALGLIVNSLIMHLGTDILRIHYILTQLVATGSVLIWNFAGNYLWSFREKTIR